MKTVLVVDDEYAIVELLSHLLEDEGYRVITASNGREALSRLAEARPNLILCDVMMPTMDGRELCRILRGDPHLHTIPLVMMSAVSEAISQAEYQYTAFVSKPFDMDRLLTIIGALVS